MLSSQFQALINNSLCEISRIMKCLDTIETEWLQYSTIANLGNVEDKCIFLSISCTAGGLHDKSCVSSNMLFVNKTGVNLPRWSPRLVTKHFLWQVEGCQSFLKLDFRKLGKFDEAQCWPCQSLPFQL